MHAFTINNRENCIEKLSWLNSWLSNNNNDNCGNHFFSEDEDMQMSVLDDDCV